MCHAKFVAALFLRSIKTIHFDMKTTGCMVVPPQVWFNTHPRIQQFNFLTQTCVSKILQQRKLPKQKHSPGLPHPSISMVPFCRPSRAHSTDQTNVPYRNANVNSISSMRRATLMFQNEHMLFVVGRAFFPGTTLRWKHLKSHKTSHMFAKTPPNRLKNLAQDLPIFF